MDTLARYLGTLVQGRFSAVSATTSTKRPYEVHLPGSYGSGTGTKADAFASRPQLDDGEVNP